MFRPCYQYPLCCSIWMELRQSSLFKWDVYGLILIGKFLKPTALERQIRIVKFSLLSACFTLKTLIASDWFHRTLNLQESPMWLSYLNATQNYIGNCTILSPWSQSFQSHLVNLSAQSDLPDPYCLVCPTNPIWSALSLLPNQPNLICLISSTQPAHSDQPDLFCPTSPIFDLFYPFHLSQSNLPHRICLTFST